MAKCKDCLHYEACSAFSKVINAAMDVEKGCEHFKDRTKYAEVVLCKDCEYQNSPGCPMCHEEYYFDEDDGGDYYLIDKAVDPNGFCSYGERKDGDGK